MTKLNVHQKLDIQLETRTHKHWRTGKPTVDQVQKRFTNDLKQLVPPDATMNDAVWALVKKNIDAAANGKNEYGNETHYLALMTSSAALILSIQ